MTISSSFFVTMIPAGNAFGISAQQKLFQPFSIFWKKLTKWVERNKISVICEAIPEIKKRCTRDRLGGRTKMLQRFKKEICDIRNHPIKIVLSVLTLALMSVLTALAWDGVIKRLIICVMLTVLSSILLLTPRLSNWISIPLLAVYLFYVPMKIFQRMELPIHDMSKIMDGVTELTIAFIICVYLLVFLFTQSSAAALGGGSGFFLIMFLLEYYIWKFRGDFLMPSDLRAAGTAVSVMKNYHYNLSPEAIYTVVYFLFFIVLGSRIRIHMRKSVHVGVSVLAVLLIGGWYYLVMDTPNPLGKEFEVNYWLIPETRLLNGACMSYFLLLKDSKVDIPDNYSEKVLLEIAETAAANYEPCRGTGQKPDIIMIMNEAWSDLRVLGELDTTEEYMPFVDSLTGNTLKGDLYVGILGGLTANTEFEALTGNSLALLSPSVIPYQNQVRHDMPSLARVLENQGYETMSMHPNGEGTWSRNRVYAYFGFDEFVHQGTWGVPYEYVGGFISDVCNYKEIIHRYENRNQDAPFFLFNVTIQNHSDYKGQVPLDIDVLNVGSIPAAETGYLYDVQTYLNLMKISDDAIKELLTYFQQVDTPVIICIFGDHQPLLNNDFYNAVFTGQGLSEREQNLQKHIVPYVMWANYDADWEEYGNMSANYLPAVLMECAGLQLPPFYKYLMELRQEYPVLTKMGCLNREGKLIDIMDIWDTGSICQYRMLQYNQLYVKDYQRRIFEEAGTLTQ